MATTEPDRNFLTRSDPKGCLPLPPLLAVNARDTATGSVLTMILDHEHVDGENACHHEERDPHLGELHMNPRITTSQNDNARAATAPIASLPPNDLRSGNSETVPPLGQELHLAIDSKRRVVRAFARALGAFLRSI